VRFAPTALLPLGCHYYFSLYGSLAITDGTGVTLLFKSNVPCVLLFTLRIHPLVCLRDCLVSMRHECVVLWNRLEH
jgi:hypothetical protein